MIFHMCYVIVDVGLYNDWRKKLWSCVLYLCVACYQWFHGSLFNDFEVGCYGSVLDTWTVTNSSTEAFMITVKQDFMEVHIICRLYGEGICTNFETGIVLTYISS
jgi:hypothetical protein